MPDPNVLPVAARDELWRAWKRYDEAHNELELMAGDHHPWPNATEVYERHDAARLEVERAVAAAALVDSNQEATYRALVHAARQLRAAKEATNAAMVSGNLNGMMDMQKLITEADNKLFDALDALAEPAVVDQQEAPKTTRERAIEMVKNDPRIKEAIERGREDMEAGRYEPI